MNEPMRPLLLTICLFAWSGIVYTQTDNTRLENFHNPPLHYHMNPNVHGFPLEEEKQIALLDNLLLSGYGGLTTNVNWTEDYLKNDRQLASFYQFVRLARQRNMEVWLYDEFLYPSGMAGNDILAEHPDWEAEGLLFRESEVEGGSQLKTELLPGHVLVVQAIPLDNNLLQREQRRDLRQQVKDGILEWDVPAGKWKIVMISTGALYHGFQAGTDRGGHVPRYTSLLMPEVTTQFIDLTHRKYADFLGDKLGSLFYSTFTDEPSAMAMPYPNLGYGVYPWKNNVSDEFLKRYGYTLEEQLLPMMLDEGQAGQKARVQYFSIIADFMANHYFKPIKEFCRRQDFKSGGHLLLEESLMAHVPLYGNIMACYREMDIPGIDFAGMNKNSKSAKKRHCSNIMDKKCRNMFFTNYLQTNLLLFLFHTEKAAVLAWPHYLCAPVPLCENPIHHFHDTVSKFPKNLQTICISGII